MTTFTEEEKKTRRLGRSSWVVFVLGMVLLSQVFPRLPVKDFTAAWQFFVAIVAAALAVGLVCGVSLFLGFRCRRRSERLHAGAHATGGTVGVLLSIAFAVLYLVGVLCALVGMARMGQHAR